MHDEADLLSFDPAASGPRVNPAERMVHGCILLGVWIGLLLRWPMPTVIWTAAFFAGYMTGLKAHAR